MPIYEYHCLGCGKDFEELVLSKSSAINCPKCHGSEVEKLMSATSFKSSEKFASSSGGSSCSSCSATSCSTCGSN